MEPPEDELRPVTVLFADIVGSTALGERLSPAEVKALVGECVSALSRAVEEFGGTVQAYMGDGICAYFGVPRAFEDDAERAARAALRIVEVAGRYGRDVAAAWGIEGFAVRVGVNSGQVAVGLVGGAEPQQVALGDTTNVAARLESQAEPGTVVVGGSTAARLGHRFVLEPIGEVAVKGRAEPVAAWRLVRARAAVEPGPRLPLAGRDAEIARLASAVDELVAGRGQVLMLTGEAGIGKSRLLSTLREASLGGVTWLQADCVSYGSQLVLFPFVELLREWLGVGEGEPELALRTKLRARLGELVPEAVPALGRLLGVRVDPAADRRLDALAPDDLAAAIRGAYAAWLERLAAERPLVLVVEDVHWADASTRRLAEDLLALSDRAAVLLAFTFRPDPSSEAWPLRLRALADYPHRTVELPLGPLPEDAAVQILAGLLPGVLDEDARREIVGRSEGNPLYLEELLRALVGGGGLVRRRTWTLDADAARRLLPPALENLLVARIDSLPEGARRLAQLAAVVGRTFPVAVLEHVLGADAVARDLPVLLRAELARELRRFPQLECTFKHGLLREAALATMTPERLREAHGRIAHAFEEVFADGIAERLDQLARLYASSDELEKAHDYLLRAAARAEELDAPGQAADLRRRAERVAQQLAEREGVG